MLQTKKVSQTNRQANLLKKKEKGRNTRNERKKRNKTKPKAERKNTGQNKNEKNVLALKKTQSDRQKKNSQKVRRVNKYTLIEKPTSERNSFQRNTLRNQSTLPAGETHRPERPTMRTSVAAAPEDNKRKKR